ncbi:MAG: hypothetical protein ACYC27_05025 [Armatimonadota bacterium]
MRKILYALLAVSIILINGCSSNRMGEADITEPGIKFESGCHIALWEIPDKDTGFMASAPCYAEYLKQLPEGVKTPAFKSKSPLLGVIKVGFKDKIETKIYFAIDESEVTGLNHDTLYLDANRNLDLTDDGRTIGRIDHHNMPKFPGTGYFTSAAKLPLNELLPSSNNHNPVELDLQIELNPKASPYMRNNIRGCYACSVTTNKGNVHFQIWDMNLNGCYDDKWSAKQGHRSYYDADIIVFGKNKIGEHYGDEPTFSMCTVSNADSLNQKLYTLTPYKSGGSFHIADYTGPTGKVSLKMGKIGNTETVVGHKTLKIFGDDGIFDIPSDGKQIDLPVGEYHAFVMDIDLVKGGEYKFWPLEYYHSAPIMVKEGQTTVIPIEGNIKFLIAPDVKNLVLKRGVKNGTPIRYLLPKGELVHVGGDGLSTVPTFKLIDKSGKVVYKGETNLDRYTYRDLSILPKNIKPGRYTVEATHDLGPYGGFLKTSREAIVK